VTKEEHPVTSIFFFCHNIYFIKAIKQFINGDKVLAYEQVFTAPPLLIPLSLLIICFNSLSPNATFLRLAADDIQKALWQKVKLLVTSNFTFCNNAFSIYSHTTTT